MAYVAATDPFELLATLHAYARVVMASWPSLHPQLAQRRARWANAAAGDLKGELSCLLDETHESPLAVRVFWKLAPDYTYRGANLLCARDAGFAAIERVVGLSDYSSELPWNRQAPQYRKNDKTVVERRIDKLDVLERMDQHEGHHVPAHVQGAARSRERNGAGRPRRLSNDRRRSRAQAAARTRARPNSHAMTP